MINNCTFTADMMTERVAIRPLDCVLTGYVATGHRRKIEVEFKHI